MDRGVWSLAGHSPWGCKESDLSEQLTPSLRYGHMVLQSTNHMCPALKQLTTEGQTEVWLKWFSIRCLVIAACGRHNVACKQSNQARLELGRRGKESIQKRGRRGTSFVTWTWGHEKPSSKKEPYLQRQRGGVCVCGLSVTTISHWRTRPCKSHPLSILAFVFVSQITIMLKIIKEKTTSKN